MAGGTLLLHVRGDQSIGTSTFDAFYAAGSPIATIENPNSGSGVSHANNAGGYGSGNNVYSFTATWAWLIYDGFKNADFTGVSGAFTIGARIIPRFTGAPAGDTCIMSVHSNTLYINGLKIEWLAATQKIKVTMGDRLGFSTFTMTSVNAYPATSGTPLEVSVQWDGSVTANAVKLIVNRVLDSSATAVRSAQANHKLTTIMIGRDANGVDPFENFDLVEAWAYSGVDSVATDPRSTWITSTQFDGSNSVSAGAGNIKTGITEIINGATITGTFSPTYTAASNVRSGTDRGDGTLGTCVVPAASDTRAGTPVDNTVGTMQVVTNQVSKATLIGRGPAGVLKAR